MYMMNLYGLLLIMGRYSVMESVRRADNMIEYCMALRRFIKRLDLGFYIMGNPLVLVGHYSQHTYLLERPK